DTARVAAQTLRVEVQTLARRARVEHNRPHQAPPKKRGPIIWAWPEVALIDQTIFAGCEGIVKDRFYAPLGQPAHLIHVTERVEERRGQGLPPQAASAVSVIQIGVP